MAVDVKLNMKFQTIESTANTLESRWPQLAGSERNKTLIAQIFLSVHINQYRLDQHIFKLEIS